MYAFFVYKNSRIVNSFKKQKVKEMIVTVTAECINDINFFKYLFLDKLIVEEKKLGEISVVNILVKSKKGKI